MDGNYHLHAYLSFHKRYQSRGSHTKLELHRDDPPGRWYPNVKGITYKLGWIQYLLKKDRDNDHKTIYSEGFDPEAYVKARGKKKSTAGAHLIAGHTPKEIVQMPGNEYLAINFHSLKKAHAALTLDTEAPPDCDGVRGIWCVGLPGTGKTHWAKQVSLRKFGRPPFIMTETKWVDGYDKEEVIVIEDLDPSTAYVHQHNLKHWADKFATTAEFKGGKTWLHHKILIVTSNYTIEELYGPDGEKHSSKQQLAKQKMFEAIRDRFTVKHFALPDGFKHR